MRNLLPAIISVMLVGACDRIQDARGSGSPAAETGTPASPSPVARQAKLQSSPKRATKGAAPPQQVDERKWWDFSDHRDGKSTHIPSRGGFPLIIIPPLLLLTLLGIRIGCANETKGAPPEPPAATAMK